MDDRSTAWLRVGRAAVPDSVKQAVLSIFPDPIDALTADLSAVASNRQSTARRQTLDSFVRHDQVRQDIEWLSAPGRSVLGLSDPRFSRLLREIPNPPAIIYCEAELALLDRPAIAIVGSRNPTPVGCESAMRFADTIGNQKVAVVSGLALGIDSVAHRGALDTAGSTIAVCATGLDTVYPRCHRNLAGEIRNAGLMLSEFPPGTGVRRHHFPQRNRLISGLSLGTLIIEAGLGSGSLITAGFAGDQGREVFALPGSVNSPLSRGPHQLIRDGACLVETPNQILESLSLVEVEKNPRETEVEEPVKVGGILGFVDFAPTPINDIAQRSGLTIAKISAMLIRMEMQGLVKTCSGGYIRLR
tara:strand:- start:86 stop:1162 length:1077 start_codon:yes stop_codon:yes gene_type:complete